MADLRKTNSRRRLLIHPKFQLAFLSYMLGFSVIITAVMLISTYYYYQGSIGEGLAFGYEKDHIFFDFLREQYTELNGVIIGAAVVSTLILLFGGLYLSHRIVGPILRFKNELYKIGETGELHEIKFRNNDYFKDLAETFNHEMQRFQQKRKK